MENETTRFLGCILSIKTKAKADGEVENIIGTVRGVDLEKFTITLDEALVNGEIVPDGFVLESARIADLVICGNPNEDCSYSSTRTPLKESDQVNLEQTEQVNNFQAPLKEEESERWSPKPKENIKSPKKNNPANPDLRLKQNGNPFIKTQKSPHVQAQAQSIPNSNENQSFKQSPGGPGHIRPKASTASPQKPNEQPHFNKPSSPRPNSKFYALNPALIVDQKTSIAQRPLVDLGKIFGENGGPSGSPTSASLSPKLPKPQPQVQPKSPASAGTGTPSVYRASEAERQYFHSLFKSPKASTRLQEAVVNDLVEIITSSPAQGKNNSLSQNQGQDQNQGLRSQNSENNPGSLGSWSTPGKSTKISLIADKTVMGSLAGNAQQQSTQSGLGGGILSSLQTKAISTTTTTTKETKQEFKILADNRNPFLKLMSTPGRREPSPNKGLLKMNGDTGRRGGSPYQDMQQKKGNPKGAEGSRFVRNTFEMSSAEIKSMEFDFEENLAQFEKLPVSTNGKPNVAPPVLGGSGPKFNNGDTTYLADRSIESIKFTKKAPSKYFMTDTGVLIPACDVSTRSSVFNMCHQLGLNHATMVEVMGRAVTQVCVPLLGDSYRLSPEREDDRPTVLVCTGPHWQGAVGLAAARILATMGIHTYVHAWKEELALCRNEENLFILTGQKLTRDVKNLRGLHFDLVVLARDDHLVQEITASAYIQWLRNKPVVLVDPPVLADYKASITNGTDQNGPSRISIVTPSLPLPYPNDPSVKIHMVNMGIPHRVFEKHGIIYKSPFGNKSTIQIFSNTKVQE